MEAWKKRAVELISGLALTDAPIPSTVAYTPQKLNVSSPEGCFYRRSTPEKHGVSSSRLVAMLREMENTPAANIHSLLVLTDGDVIMETSAPGYDVHIRHLAHSMSKTVTGLALGFAFDAGKLDLNAKLVSFFPEIPYRDKRFASITVDNLLSMSAGVPFAEAGSVTESHWTEAFFDSAMKYEPGTEFSYNSMNSYLCARILEKAMGRSFIDVLKEKLLDPLDISNFEWEIGPEGTAKGGWGLYLSPESWAKLGEMVLSLGQFHGKRILSEEWIARMTTTHSVTKAENGDFNYGYQIWVEREGDEVLFNGMLGQNVWISPKNNTVAVISAGNNELFSRSPSLDVVRKYLKDIKVPFGTEPHAKNELQATEKTFFIGRHWIRPKAPNKGLSVLLGLRKKMPFDEAVTPLLGKWRFRKNNDGILPLFVRLMQNNFQGGISSFTFTRVGERLFFESAEGNSAFKMEVGFYDFAETVLDFGGEKYLVRCMLEAMEDEDRHTLYKLELLFPELPNTRFIKLSFTEGGKLLVRLSENPNQRIGETYLSSAKQSGQVAFVLDLVSKRTGGGNFIEKKLFDVFNPVLTGISDTDPLRDEKLAEEETLREASLGENRLLVSLIKRFISEDAPAESHNPISGFFSLFGFGKSGKKDTAFVPDDDLAKEVFENLPAPEDDLDENK